MSLKTILLVGVLASALPVNHAAAAEPIRLAIINENDSVATANDLLTVQLSQKENLQLFERAQIDKALREQTLTAGKLANRDFLKIGELLGADGVIVLEMQKAGDKSMLNTRLVAAKPGVILGAMPTPWPLSNSTEWAKLILAKFAPLWPKLSVLPKDAVPISILNLRGAANSAESIEVDHELTLLLLNRLMLEKEVFVLERRMIGGLTDEKTLQKSEDSPFWKGSFLVDGIIDKSGFSKEQLTVDARLSPPTGGTPTAISIGGDRKDLPKIADVLARKILAGLQKKTSLAEWKPAEEAAQFLNEAKWALRWKVFRQAQDAAESAWALGQQDTECADIRVRSYVYDIVGGAFNLTTTGASLDNYPFAPLSDRAKLDQTLHALELYYDYIKRLPEDRPIIVSSWYFTGVEAVNAASWVLQHYYFVPALRKADADKLAELRFLIREIVARIYRSPTVHNAYWTGDRIDYSSVPNYKDPNPNPIKMEGEYRGSLNYSKFDWGCFWQETPEDCLALYRELLTSDVFAKYSRSLWFRGPRRPRVTAWNSEDEKRIPELWSRFLVELKASTNFVHQIEANSFLLADAKTDSEIEPAFNELFNVVFAHTNEIAKHNVDFHFDWKFEELTGKALTGSFSPLKEGLRKRFRTEIFSRLSAISSARLDYLTGIKIPPIVRNADGSSGNPKQIARIHSIDATPVTKAMPLTQFFAIPKEKLESDVKTIEICAHKVRQGKVWLDLQYRTENPRKVKDGQVQYSFSAFAVLDLGTASWEIIKRPVRESYFVGGRAGEAGEGPAGDSFYFEVFHDAIYCSDKDRWQKYDLKTGRWETLTLPGQVLAQFFIIEDHLYATTPESILEILDGGQSSRVLASTRRLPPETSLDSLPGFLTKMFFPMEPIRAFETHVFKQNSPMLFPGPNHSLRANIGKTIYTYNGKNWSESFILPKLGIPEISDDSTVLIRPVNAQSAQVWLVSDNQTNAEFCFEQRNPDKLVASRAKIEEPSSVMGDLRPLWTPAEDFPLLVNAITWQSNLYYLIDCSTVTTNSAGRREVDSASPQMRLARFDRDLSTPLTIALDFPQTVGPTPTGRAVRDHLLDLSSPWILFTSGAVIIGNRNTPGIWMVDERVVTAAFTAAKSTQQVKASALRK